MVIHSHTANIHTSHSFGFERVWKNRGGNRKRGSGVAGIYKPTKQTNTHAHTHTPSPTSLSGGADQTSRPLAESGSQLTGDMNHRILNFIFFLHKLWCTQRKTTSKSGQEAHDLKISFCGICSVFGEELLQLQQKQGTRRDPKLSGSAMFASEACKQNKTMPGWKLDEAVGVGNAQR